MADATGHRPTSHPITGPTTIASPLLHAVATSTRRAVWVEGVLCGATRRGVLRTAVCGRRPGRGGQALVEFALVAPMLVFGLLGMVGALFFITQQTSVVHAAQVGSRVAAQSVSPSSVQPALAEVRRALPPILDQALPGTRVEYFETACPPPSSLSGAGLVAVCAAVVPGSASGTSVISVHIYGHVTGALPGFPSLAVDETSVVHFLGFSA